MSASTHIGFVSTRLAGLDGVSLEAGKWASVLTRRGHKCFYMAGQLDQEPSHCFLVEKAHFDHPLVRDVQANCFGLATRAPETSARIHELREHLKEQLYAFTRKFDIDILIAENCLAIPMNLALGLALTEFIAETGTPTIAHDHDFFWERQRFLETAAWDYLNMAFPPHLPPIRHVVINSSQSNQLSLRTGIAGMLLPNVMDFDNPPAIDDYAHDIREELGIAGDEYFILQPTRVVQRKGIEHSIELVHWLGKKARLVISHSAGDEGWEYEVHIRHYAEMLGVEPIFAGNRIREHRGVTDDGKKLYSIYDAYAHADLVTYPSTFEGFGNAFLESIYYRRPLLVNNYSIYRTDIRPQGYRCVEIDGFMTDQTVDSVREILTNPAVREEMVEHNYQLAKVHYSYTFLERKLGDLIDDVLAGRQTPAAPH